MVELVKVVGGKPALVDNLPNYELIQCTHCPQTYQFRYSNGESDRLKEWLPKAQAVVDSSHSDDHSAATLSVDW